MVGPLKWLTVYHTNMNSLFYCQTYKTEFFAIRGQIAVVFCIDGHSDKCISQLINLCGLVISSIVWSLLIKFNFQFVVL